MQGRYTKLRSSASSFLVTQYGICTFHFNKETSSYTAKAFNFYVFPRTCVPSSSNNQRSHGLLARVFSAQTTSLEFLANFDFDFNLWIKEGVSFMNLDQESRLRQKMEQVATTRQNEDLVVDDREKPFYNDFMSKMTDWLQNSTEKTLKITTQNGYQRKIVYHFVRKEGNGYVLAEGFGDAAMQLKKVTAEEKANLEKQSVQNTDKELSELSGFRKVIDAIRKAKKPIIGHNMFLDLAHTMNQFVHFLPQEYTDFQEQVKDAFPMIFDTKYMCAAVPELAAAVPKTSLNQVFDRVQTDPFTAPTITMDEEFQYAANCDRFHEAGYDAYTTGFAFIRLMHHIQKQLPLNLDSVDFKNRINMMYSDFEYADIHNDQPIPDRSHIFYIPDVPSTNTEKEMDQLLRVQEYGGVFYRWRNATECFVMLKEKEKKQEFAKIKKSLPIKVLSFDEHLELIKRETQSAAKRVRID